MHHGARDPAAARVSRAHSARDVNRLSSGIRRGEALIPRPVVRGPTATVLPRSRSPVPSPGRFGCATTRYVDRPQAAMGSRHRPGTAPGPVGDRPPPSRPRRRSNSDHAGKSTYSGKIESLDRNPGIETLVPGNAISRELTSLLCTLCGQCL